MMNTSTVYLKRVNRSSVPQRVDHKNKKLKRYLINANIQSNSVIGDNENIYIYMTFIAYNIHFLTQEVSKIRVRLIPTGLMNRGLEILPHKE